MKILYSVAVLSLLSCALKAQIVVDQSVNYANGVTNYLVGEGVSVSNITSVGDNNQAGSFSVPAGNTVFNFPLTAGFVLSTGNVALSAGPNLAANSSTAFNLPITQDSDLDALTSANINQLKDLAKVEFDFIPTGDTVKFNYIFASEEYPEDVDLMATDVFGFFLSGPGINGPYSNNAINMAVIPQTTLPVSINNVNNGPANAGPCDNCAYFVYNGNGSQAPYNTSNQYLQADGFTTLLTAFALVECGQTYHIKLAICDVGDANGNSWVFLETGSFNSSAASLVYTPPTYTPFENGIYEGCGGGVIHYERPSNAVGDFVVDVIVAGSAVNGSDYESIPTQFTLTEEDESIDIPIVAINDGAGEATETIELTFSSDLTCANNSTFELSIVEVSQMTVTDNDISVYCDANANLSLNIGGGVGDYTVDWSTDQVGNPVVWTDPVAGTVTYTVTDGCDLVNPVTGSINVSITPYPAISVNVGADQTIDCTEDISISPTVSGGNGDYDYQWLIDDEEYSTTTNFFDGTPNTSTVVLEVTDACGATGSDQMEIILTNAPLNVSLGNDLSGNCVEELTVSASSTGGVGTADYSWTVDGSPAGTGSSIDVLVGDGGVVIVTATDDCGTEDTDQLTITETEENIDVDINAITGNCYDVLNASAVVNGGAGDLDYAWYVNDDNAGSGTTASVTIGLGTEVTLVVTDECGTSDTDTQIVSVTTEPINVSIGGDISTDDCFADIYIDIDNINGGTGNYDYEWTMSTEADPIGYDSYVNIQAGGNDNATVTVNVSDECGSTGSDALVIDLTTAAISINMAPTLAVDCLEAFTLSPQVTGGSGGNQYVWTIEDTPVGFAQSYSGTTTENLQLDFTVIDACNNEATDAITISVNASTLDVNLTSSPTGTLCPGDPVTITASINGAIISTVHDWSVPGAGTSVVVNPDETTTYSIEVTDECNATATDDITISVYDTQSEPLTAMSQMDLCLGVTSENIVDGGVLPYDIEWPTGIITHSGYTITGVAGGDDQIVITDHCGATVLIDLEVKDCTTVIPNVFTPNDDGKNETYVVQGLSGFPGSRLVIYNRWGNIVLDDPDYKNDWTAKDVAAGTYFFVLQRSDNTAYEGTITVLKSE